MLHSSAPSDRVVPGFSLGGAGKPKPPSTPQTYGQVRAWEDLDRQAEDLKILASRFAHGEARVEILKTISQVIGQIKLAVVTEG